LAIENGTTGCAPIVTMFNGSSLTVVATLATSQGFTAAETGDIRLLFPPGRDLGKIVSVRFFPLGPVAQHPVAPLQVALIGGPSVDLLDSWSR
jgi:hypothetical protein